MLKLQCYYLFMLFFKRTIKHTNSHETRSYYTNCIISLNERNCNNTYSLDCSTAVFLGQKCKTTSVQVFSSYMVGVSDAPGGTNYLLLLKIGVGLLTASGGPLGGIICHGAGEVGVAHCLTLSGVLLSLSSGSLGGCGLYGGCF